MTMLAHLKITSCLLFIAGWAAPLRAQSASPLVEVPSWRKAFDSAGVSGTVVLRRLGRAATQTNGIAYDSYDSDAYPYQTSDSIRARQLFLPASTFKVPNAIIALELGIAGDERQRYPFSWPRTTVSESWNRDQTLATAMKYSVVPVFQEIARAVGESRYREWLHRMAYGNKNPSGGVDHFWLDGELRTSAVQQIDFLGRLAERRLPVSERSQRIVADILVREANDCFVLRGKTGLVGIEARRVIQLRDRVAWYVGWVQTDTAAWAFALVVDAAQPASARVRVPLLHALLQQAGVIQSGCAP